jgi:hypothetical protein
MKIAGAILLALMVAGCQHEDAGVRAAKMEAQDDATCQQRSAGKGADAYQECRKNLMYYRQQAQIEDAQQQARVQAAAASFQRAGAALQSINQPPTSVNVNCFGCR